MTIRVDVRVDDAALRAAMRDTRRELDDDVKAVFHNVGTTLFLPAARRAVPSRTGELRRSLVFRATTRGGYIRSTLTRRQGRRFGLLEFGGTRTDVIQPRQARALRFGGRFAARVTTPRTYPARLWVTGARDERMPRIVRGLETGLADAVQAHIDRNAARLGR